MTTCIIHIGTVKTGTTLLQRWLRANEASLSQAGVALSTVAGHPASSNLLHYVKQKFKPDYAHPETKVRSNSCESYTEVFAKELFQEIEKKKATHQHFIFSSEHLHIGVLSNREISVLKELLDRHFSEYRIICYFREQSKMRTSLYTTTLHSNNSQHLSDFHRHVGLKNLTYNYGLFLRNWESVFGIKSLRPRLYDHNTFLGGDIRRDFLETAIPHVEPAALSFDLTTANASMGQSLSAIFRTINSRRPGSIADAPDPTPQFLKNMILRLGFLDDRDPLIDDRQQEMYDAFFDTNLDFFERYFGVRENLFSRPTATKRDPSRREISKAPLAELFDRIVSAENLLILKPAEKASLKNLAHRIDEGEATSSDDAKLLLRLVGRASPQSDAVGANALK